MISEGVDGSALSYIISYTDSNTGELYSSLTLPASSCKQGTCTVPFISPMPCSDSETVDGDGDIDISISANNRLGRGSPTVTTIGTLYMIELNFYLKFEFMNFKEFMNLRIS